MKNIAVIGGGVVGLCSAYYLSEAGMDVTVVSDDENSTGCSYGNAGMITPSHFVPLASPDMLKLGIKLMFKPDGPFYLKPKFDKNLISWVWKFYRAANASQMKMSMPVLQELNMLSRSLYIEMADSECLNFSLQTKGLIMLCKTKHTLDQEAHLVPLAQKLGMQAEVLMADELMKLDDGIEMNVTGGVYFPMDAFMAPGLFMSEMKALLEQRGVKFVSKHVTNLSLQNNKVTAISTEQSNIEADEFIVAAGVWSAELLQALKVNMPLQAGKGYSVTIDKPSYSPQICSILTEARVAVTPMNDGIRFGGTMELNGSNERKINHRRVNGMFRSIPSYYPQFEEADFKSSEVWAGLRPCSPDGLPYIGRLKHYENLTVATGHAMMGMSLGPITGKLVTQILMGDKLEMDISLLNPDRYN